MFKITTSIYFTWSRITRHVQKFEKSKTLRNYFRLYSYIERTTPTVPETDPESRGQDEVYSINVDIFGDNTKFFNMMENSSFIHLHYFLRLQILNLSQIQVLRWNNVYQNFEIHHPFYFKLVLKTKKMRYIHNSRDHTKTKRWLSCRRNKEFSAAKYLRSLC